MKEKTWNAIGAALLVGVIAFGVFLMGRMYEEARPNWHVPPGCTILAVTQTSGLTTYQMLYSCRAREDAIPWKSSR